MKLEENTAHDGRQQDLLVQLRLRSLCANQAGCSCENCARHLFAAVAVCRFGWIPTCLEIRTQTQTSELSSSIPAERREMFASWLGAHGSWRVPGQSVPTCSALRALRQNTQQRVSLAFRGLHKTATTLYEVHSTDSRF